MIPAIIAAAVAVAAAAAQAGIAADTANKQKSIADQLGEDYDKIPLSQYEQSNLPKYKPNLLKNPGNIGFEQIKRDPEARQKFMDAIGEYMKMSNSAINSQSDLERQKSAMDAEQAASARNAAIRSQMYASGRGGSGLQFGLQDAENQGAANSRYLGGLQAAADAQRERLNAFKAYQDALSQNENTDLGIQEKNTNIINQFNALNAQRRDEVSRRNTDILNDADLKNIGLRQWDVLRNDTNSNNTFQQRMAKQGGKSNAMNQKSVAIGDEGANYSAAVGTLGKLAGQYLGYQYGADGDGNIPKRKNVGGSS